MVSGLGRDHSDALIGKRWCAWRAPGSRASGSAHGAAEDAAAAAIDRAARNRSSENALRHAAPATGSRIDDLPPIYTGSDVLGSGRSTAGICRGRSRRARPGPVTRYIFARRRWLSRDIASGRTEPALRCWYRADVAGRAILPARSPAAPPFPARLRRRQRYDLHAKRLARLRRAAERGSELTACRGPRRAWRCASSIPTSKVVTEVRGRRPAESNPTSWGMSFPYSPDYERARRAVGSACARSPAGLATRFGVPTNRREETMGVATARSPTRCGPKPIPSTQCSDRPAMQQIFAFRRSKWEPYIIVASASLPYARQATRPLTHTDIPANARCFARRGFFRAAAPAHLIPSHAGAARPLQPLQRSFDRRRLITCLSFGNVRPARLIPIGDLFASPEQGHPQSSECVQSPYGNIRGGGRP